MQSLAIFHFSLVLFQTCNRPLGDGELQHQRELQALIHSSLLCLQLDLCEKSLLGNTLYNIILMQE